MDPTEASVRLNAWHQEAGQALAGHWDLPPMLAEVMGCHHNPDPESTYFEITGLVSLADCLACEMGFDGGIYPCTDDIPQWLPPALGFSGDDLATFRRDLRQPL
jgi:HD-like signal output (HDOD) protein